MNKLRLSPAEEEAIKRQHAHRERIKRMMAVRHGEVIRSKRIIARMKLAEDMQCKEDKKHSIIHNINSYKEELRALIQAKEDIEVTLDQGRRNAHAFTTALSSGLRQRQQQGLRDEELVWLRYQHALDAIHQERERGEDDEVVKRIIDARDKANKLSSSFKPKNTQFFPSDDIFIKNEKDNKRGAWMSHDLLTQYAETAFHAYDNPGEIADDSILEDSCRKRKPVLPHDWDSIVADRGRKALMKERDRIRCEEAERDIDLQRYMQRKAKADIIVAERARKIGEERKQPLVEVATITTIPGKEDAVPISQEARDEVVEQVIDDEGEGRMPRLDAAGLREGKEEVERNGIETGERVPVIGEGVQGPEERSPKGVEEESKEGSSGVGVEGQLEDRKEQQSERPQVVVEEVEGSIIQEGGAEVEKLCEEGPVEEESNEAEERPPEGKGQQQEVERRPQYLRKASQAPKRLSQGKSEEEMRLRASVKERPKDNQQEVEGSSVKLRPMNGKPRGVNNAVKHGVRKSQEREVKRRQQGTCPRRSDVIGTQQSSGRVSQEELWVVVRGKDGDRTPTVDPTVDKGSIDVLKEVDKHEGAVLGVEVMVEEQQQQSSRPTHDDVCPPTTRAAAITSFLSGEDRAHRDESVMGRGVDGLSLSLLSYPSDDTRDSIEQLIRQYEMPSLEKEEPMVMIEGEDDWKAQLDNLKKELDEIYASFADTSRLDNSDISAAAAADDGKGSIKGSAEISDTTLMLSEGDSTSFTSTELAAAIAEVTAGISGHSYLGGESFDVDLSAFDISTI